VNFSHPLGLTVELEFHLKVEQYYDWNLNFDFSNTLAVLLGVDNQKHILGFWNPVIGDCCLATRESEEELYPNAEISLLTDGSAVNKNTRLQSVPRLAIISRTCKHEDSVQIPLRIASYDRLGPPGSESRVLIEK